MTNKICASLIRLMFLYIVASSSVKASSSGVGLEFFFLNGVWVIEKNAEKTLSKYAEETSRRIPDLEQYAFESSVLYNPHNDSFKGQLEDVLEVLDQKNLEFEEFNREIYLSELPLPKDDSKFYFGCRDPHDGTIYSGCVDSEYSAYLEARERIREIYSELGTIPLDVNLYKKHRRQVMDARNEGKLTLIVSHSQGNLLANNLSSGLNFHLQQFQANVQIASTVDTITDRLGLYTTLECDRVVFLLRLIKPILPGNISCPIWLSGTGASNHEAIKAYLNEGTEAPTQIFSHIKIARESMSSYPMSV